MNTYIINKKKFDNHGLIECFDIFNNSIYDDIKGNLKYNKEDIYVYEGDFLPDCIEVCEDGKVTKKDFIESIHETEKDNINSYHAEPIYSEDICKDTVFYIDTNCSKDGRNVVLTSLNRKILNYKDYFDGNAIEYIGDSVPEYLKIDYENLTASNYSRIELIKLGLDKLEPMERIIDGKIITLKMGQYVTDDGVITSKPLPNKHISYIWDYQTDEWCRTTCDAEELNIINRKIIDETNNYIALKNLGFDTMDVEKKIKELEIVHRTLSESVAEMIKNKQEE